MRQPSLQEFRDIVGQTVEVSAAVKYLILTSGRLKLILHLKMTDAC
jgi:hypothetical protein